MYKWAAKGVNRVTWNFGYEGIGPVTAVKFDPVVEIPRGRRGGGGIIQVMPGTYNVALSIHAKGETKELSGPVSFVCKPLGLATFTSNDLKSKYVWISEASDLSRTIYGTLSYITELVNKTNAVRQVIHQAPGATPEMRKEAERINVELDKIMFIFNGTAPKASDEEIPSADLPLSQRLNEMVSASYGTTGDITTIAKDQMDILKVEFPPILERVRKADLDLQNLDKQLDAVKAPWTPGRVPLL
jgi:hypothetical protein